MKKYQEKHQNIKKNFKKNNNKNLTRKRGKKQKKIGGSSTTKWWPLLGGHVSMDLWTFQRYLVHVIQLTLLGECYMVDASELFAGRLINF